MLRLATTFSLFLILIALVGCGTDGGDALDGRPQECCIDCFGDETCRGGELWITPDQGGMCGDCDYIATLSCSEPHLAYTCAEGCALYEPCQLSPRASSLSYWCVEGQANVLTVRCGDDYTCVDLHTDAAHCGACDTKCSPGQECADSQCVCPDGLSMCGELCLDLQNDLANCGACGQACVGAETCSAGVCTCAAENLCGGSCIEVHGDDVLHCGACGQACAAGEICAQGVCAACHPFAVVDHSPATYDESVARGAAIDLTFSCEVGTPDDAAVVVHSAFRGRVPGVLSRPSASSLRFVPDTPFLPGDVVSVSATPQLLSAESVPLSPYVWRFRAQAQGGSGTFAAAPNGPQLGSGAIVGDVDGDGALDLVAGNSVLRNLGGGVFSPPDGNGNLGGQGALVDVDNDFDLDLLVADEYAEGVLMANEQGILAATGTPVPGLLPRFSAADLDGDGDLDLVVPNKDERNRLLRNDGAAGFTRIDPAKLGAHSLVAVVGNVDQDGDLDVISWDAMGATLSRNQGAATFVEEEVGPIDSWTNSARLADLDGDRTPDVALLAAFELQRWQGQGDGSFVVAPSVTATSPLQALDVGDLDGDGDLDLFTATKATTEVYLNNGSTFALGWSQGAPEQVSEIVLGDLDGDGDLDAVAGGVFLNQ